MTRSPGRPQAPGDLVDDAAAEALRRVRRRSVAWWRTQTGAGRPRARAIEDLVAALARYGADAEGLPHRAPPPPRREDVLVDQLAVVAYDLVLALRARPDPAAEARAAAACLLAAYEVEPKPLPAELADAVLTGDVGPLRDAVERLPRHGEG